MIIHFLSQIDNEGIKNEIKFSSTVEISQFQEFTVYEFMEPSKKEMNRIEVSDTKVNIMAGPSTVELELNKKLDIVFDTQTMGKLYLRTFMHSLNIKENNVNFHYSLYNQEDNEIGTFNITIKISKN